MNIQLKYRYIAIVVATLVFTACSTQKNTFVSRNYHNLTAYYNVYFNGNESLKAGLLKVETKMEEDYTKVLPIFKESMPGTETLIGSDMTRAIEKGEKLIKMHSITKPPKKRSTASNRKRKPIKEEYNLYVDDAYILMGKASLYKKDYIRASSIFIQTIRKFKNEPVKYEAYLWLIRTYSESERYSEARELIETLENDKKFPKDLEGELAINAADMHLKQQHLDEAVQYLNIGIKKIKGNKRKTRYTFILGQIYQETGKYEQALQAYRQVIRRRPNYTMLFNAQINSASVYSGKGNISELRAELIRMSKKVRNADYLDQIYYALGNLSISEGKTDEAIRYYKNSAAKSVKNTYQRALSCLTLGDIFLEQKKYIPSSSYYDSAMVLIDEHYPKYKEISDKHLNLNSLASNLQTVVTQDSLQALAKLTPDQLNSKIDRWIVDYKTKMQDPESVGSTGDYNYAYSMNNRTNIGGSATAWYFYNPSTISYGKKDFQRLWGERKNEDNWRRSNKSVSALIEDEELKDGLLAEEIKKEETKRELDPSKKEYYTQDLPKTDSLLAISHQKIRDALFNAGNMLKIEFIDFETSAYCFRELARRYPGNIYELPSYFGLWDMYSSMGKPDSSQIYKNEILGKYPTSNYAKFLQDPNFFAVEEARRDSINRLYSKAFEAYKQNDMVTAAKYSNNVLAMKPDSALLIKTQFIKIIAESKGKDKALLANALNNYANTYPKAETSKLAKEIANLASDNKLANYAEMVSSGYLNDVIKNMEILQKNASSNESGTSSNNQQENTKWEKDGDLLHYFVIAVPNKDSIDINRLKFDIANYNLDYYTTSDFDIETESLNNDHKLIVVRNFDNKENALIYFMSIMRKPYVFKTLAGHQFFNFIISNKNFRELLNDRSYNDYLSFFVKNYSTRTSIEIKDEDLETPEMLMAKLRQDQNENVVKDEGFVEVKISDALYNPLAQKEQLFKANYDVPHSLIVTIDDPRARIVSMVREIVQYNNAEHRSLRLRAEQFVFKNKTSIIVSSLPNALEALTYHKKISDNKGLFASLGDTPYKLYVISDENLSKLKETQDFDEWSKFYTANYVLRKPATTPKPDDKKQTDVVNSNTPAPNNNEKKDKEETKPAAPVNAQLTPTETKQNTAETQVNDTASPEKTVLPAEVLQSPYLVSPDSSHCLVYIVPTSGANKVQLSTYLTRLNTMSFRASNLTVTTEDLNEYQALVIVGRLSNKALASEYMIAANADARVAMSVRNINYRVYLMSDVNLTKFKTLKNIQEYQKFYDSAY